MKTFNARTLTLLVILILVQAACGFAPQTSQTEQPAEAPPSAETQPAQQETLEGTPYTDAIAKAYADCAAIELNSACFSGGTGQVSPAGTMLSAGQTLPLTGEETFNIQSDGDVPSVLVLKLAAPGIEGDSQPLVLLAVGNVDVNYIALSTPPAEDTGAAMGPSIRFSSTPMANGAASGLYFVNAAEDDLISFDMNDASFVIGSSGLAQTTPEGNTNIHMLTGSADVTAAGGNAQVVAGESAQIQQPMGIIEKIRSGIPLTERESDLLAQAIFEAGAQELNEEIIADFNKAFEKCMAGDSRQVYRMLYYARQMSRNGIDQNQYAEKYMRCASFELILDSKVEGQSDMSWVSEVESKGGTILQFGLDGKLAGSSQQPLTYRTFEVSMPPTPGCSQEYPHQDSTMKVLDGSMKISGNTVKVEMKLWFDIMTASLSMNCAGQAINIPLDWNTHFWYLHPDLLDAGQQAYIIRDWKYTKGEVFAEAIYADRTQPIENGVVNGTSYFILRHAPQK